MAPVVPLPSTATAGREKRIKVCVRLRPFTKNEAVRAGGKAAWTWHENTIYQQIFPAQIPSRKLTSEREKKGGSTSSVSTVNATSDNATLPSSYSFDYLYPPTSKTEEIYEETVKDAIIAAMEGYHSSVFVYGQTGTGKTYTMQGAKRYPGVIQLGVQDIFNHIAAHPEMEFLLRFSYLEIYNERIYDLLAAGAKSDIKIFDVHKSSNNNNNNQSRDGNVCKDVVIKGLREEIVLTVEHVLSLVEVGNLHRHMATTDINDQSSRSHVIFRMVIESQRKRPAGRGGLSSSFTSSNTPVRSATLNLIDLAGSEGVRLANTTGKHLEEGKYINRSLLTLGHIIWKLSRDRIPKTGSARQNLNHLPYRNSKLTRILQPSLGGQAQIAIICTASPSVECLMETHSTLKFASRARRVKNRAAVNESLGESALLKKYRARIRELEEQLETLQRRKSSASFGPRGATQANVNLSTIEERQMELKFAINNINRAILNSSNVNPPRSTKEYDNNGDHDLSHTQNMEDEDVEQEQRRPASAPTSNNSNKTASSTGATLPTISERPTIITSGTTSGESSANNSNKTLLGSGGSASTKTLPLSTSSSLPDPGEDTEMKGDDEGEEEEEPERETAPSESRSSTMGFAASGGARSSTPSSARSSLTTLLRSKYMSELNKMDQRVGRWSMRDEDEIHTQKELLLEFVRGLEIAEAEQETRMSKIHELDLENRQLRQILRSREEELMHLKNIRGEDETL